MKGTAKKSQTKSNGHRSSLGGLLARHPFAKDLSEGHLDSLASCAKLLVCMPGDFLWRQGEKPEVVYLVSSGHVALEIAIPNQGSLEIDSFESGDFLPWLWLGGEYRRHFDARVMMPGEVIALDGKVLRALCEHDHDFGYHLLKRLARATEDRLQSARLKIMELQGHSLPVGGSLS